MHELPQMHAKISSNFRKVPQVLQGYDKRTGVLWTPFSIPGLLGAFVVNITLRLYPWSPSNPCPLPLTIHLRNYDIVRDEYKCNGCKFYRRKYIVDKNIPISMS